MPRRLGREKRVDAALLERLVVHVVPRQRAHDAHPRPRGQALVPGGVAEAARHAREPAEVLLAHDRRRQHEPRERRQRVEGERVVSHEKDRAHRDKSVKQNKKRKKPEKCTAATQQLRLAVGCAASRRVSVARRFRKTSDPDQSSWACEAGSEGCRTDEAPPEPAGCGHLTSGGRAARPRGRPARGWTSARGFRCRTAPRSPAHRGFRF